MAFVLRDSCHHRKNEITGWFIRANILLLEDDCDAQCSEPLGIVLAVHDISGKPGNALANDDIQFLCFRIRCHFLKTWTTAYSCGGMTVGIHLDQLPVGMALNQLGIKYLLCLKALVLLVAQGADTAVCRYTPFCH